MGSLVPRLSPRVLQVMESWMGPENEPKRWAGLIDKFLLPTQVHLHLYGISEQISSEQYRL